MSSWARSCVVPLVVLLARKPVWRPQRAVAVDELRLPGPSNGPEPGGPWTAFFHQTDRALHALERRGLVPFRWTALQRAERWILAHQDDEGDWGGIFPAMEYSLLALRALGYPDAHPALRRGWHAIERFGLETADSYRMQACVSPVWDTALATWGLVEAGVSPDHRALTRGAEWLLSKQIGHYGDWSVKNRNATPGGWSFEFFNRFYPDVDDSAACILALCGLRLGANDAWRNASIAQACRWISSMQSRDGGWAAFDVDNTQQLWNEIPFADHKAMLDPSTPDVTGRVLEMLGTTGLGEADRIARAIRFLTDRQRADGSWYGRWGVNFVYGTWAVLCGLRAVSIAANDPRIARGADFLIRAQNADGGWGESTASYDDDRFVAGPSTASQTAWGVMGLLAAGLEVSVPVDRGLEWLVAAQRANGGWDETAFTGTGFPGHFYIRYHLYRDCFPTMALGRAVRLRANR
jgi:squalene-hopene/tetraprenyl-beta-curcumene cyclase